MSIDLPASIERDLESYAMAEHMTPVEAAVKFIQSGLIAAKPKTFGGELVTDEQLIQLRALGFGLLEDVSEDKIDRMSATIRRTKREGFARRA